MYCVLYVLYCVLCIVSCCIVYCCIVYCVLCIVYCCVYCFCVLVVATIFSFVQSTRNPIILKNKQTNKTCWFSSHASSSDTMSVWSRKFVLGSLNNCAMWWYADSAPSTRSTSFSSDVAQFILCVYSQLRPHKTIFFFFFLRKTHNPINQSPTHKQTNTRTSWLEFILNFSMSDKFPREETHVYYMIKLFGLFRSTSINSLINVTVCCCCFF